MKKIGILTFHFSLYNFGAVLQTYSTYRIIKRMGYEPVILNYTPRAKTIKGKLWEYLMTFFGHQFTRFRKEYLRNTTDLLEKDSDFAELNHQVDSFLVGSDQVWRFTGDAEKMGRYYLDFVDDHRPKIAYAVSFGVNYWPINEKKITNTIRKLVSRFKVIGVREESGKDIVQNIFNQKSTVVLDPTLVAGKEEFDTIARRFKRNNRKYLAYMIFDDRGEKQLAIHRFAKNHNMSTIKILGKKIYNPKMMYIFRSVGKWISLIRDAEFVITDSYHCMLFSIIYRKNFAVLKHPTNGNTRIAGFLKLIKQENRMIDHLEELNKNLLNTPINYTEVEDHLNPLINKSINLIKTNV
jgi:hypothetical protein